MKKSLLITMLFLLISCNNNQHNDEKIIYNTRRYLVKELDLTEALNYNINNIEIDSIVSYPKYLYLESEINLHKTTYENIITEKEQGRISKLAANNIFERLDSLKTIYAKTSKNEKYFKCYFKIGIKNSKEYDGLQLYADEEFNMLDYFFDIEELEKE